MAGITRKPKADAANPWTIWEVTCLIMAARCDDWTKDAQWCRPVLRLGVMPPRTNLVDGFMLLTEEQDQVLHRLNGLYDVRHGADWNLEEYRAEWEVLYSSLTPQDGGYLTLEEYARRMRMMAAQKDRDAPKVPDWVGPDLSFLAHSPPSEDSTIAFSREVIDEFMRTRAIEDEMDAMLARERVRSFVDSQTQTEDQFQDQPQSRSQIQSPNHGQIQGTTQYQNEEQNENFIPSSMDNP